MMIYSHISAAILAVLVVLIHETEASLDRGFGESINWKTLDDGLKLSKETDTPLMLIIHKTWCGACKALKPKFADSSEIAQLSEKFVMVNVEDDEEPKDSKYSPDGGYIPRILFLEPNGDVRDDIINTAGNEKYKYYYPNADHVVLAMKNALKKLVLNDEL
ncbi:thioredoxin domain-containing protein 12-like [Anneissia japonica]|uniref:thioredoxin domain-containing protein 12-like n=1 Tax=Anneissia japonica TaxID=1529436 RepID=UPI0014257674|nr:thioredoxin domain-containing protein 12-like [Anneissia japonica]